MSDPIMQYGSTQQKLKVAEAALEQAKKALEDASAAASAAAAAGGATQALRDAADQTAQDVLTAIQNFGATQEAVTTATTNADAAMAAYQASLKSS